MNGSLKLEDKAFLTKLAEEVKARRMTTPAIFFLEMLYLLTLMSRSFGFYHLQISSWDQNIFSIYVNFGNTNHCL